MRWVFDTGDDGFVKLGRIHEYRRVVRKKGLCVSCGKDNKLEDVVKTVGMGL